MYSKLSVKRKLVKCLTITDKWHSPECDAVYPWCLRSFAAVILLVICLTDELSVSGTQSSCIDLTFKCKNHLFHICCILSMIFFFQLLQGFIDEFFDQNPISQMGIIITKNKRAEKISELAGNPRKHMKVLVKCILMHANMSTTMPIVSLLWLPILYSVITSIHGFITAVIENEACKVHMIWQALLKMFIVIC